MKANVWNSFFQLSLASSFSSSRSRGIVAFPANCSPFLGECLRAWMMAHAGNPRVSVRGKHFAATRGVLISEADEGYRIHHLRPHAHHHCSKENSRQDEAKIQSLGRRYRQRIRTDQQLTVVKTGCGKLVHRFELECRGGSRRPGEKNSQGRTALHQPKQLCWISSQLPEYNASSGID